jgi:hypothetical protein
MSSSGQPRTILKFMRSEENFTVCTFPVGWLEERKAWKARVKHLLQHLGPSRSTPRLILARPHVEILRRTFLSAWINSQKCPPWASFDVSCLSPPIFININRVYKLISSGLVGEVATCYRIIPTATPAPRRRRFSQCRWRRCGIK